ncbi:MAG TPA: 3'-5' exonuclease, partial [Acidimicrobiales bacterium]|nr:3'-5' exonuclease [Acidimicrobiales bacterium]
MEDGVFPHLRALGEPDELEEERRLAYVGITRARERLYLTHAWCRTIFGSTLYNPPSRFLKEVPEELVDVVESASRGRGRDRDRSRSWSGSRSGSSESASATWEPRRRGREGIVEAAIRGGLHTPVRTSGAEAMGIRTGDDVVHGQWGEGVVLAIKGEGDKAEAVVRFPSVGEKHLLLAWAPLKRA